MTDLTRRGLATAFSVVAAAGAGVVTNIATNEAAWGWWAGLGVLVIVGVGLQVYLNAAPAHRAPGPVIAHGAGSVAVGGTSRGPISTKAVGHSSPPRSDERQADLEASGPGSIVIGGDAGDSITTYVRES